MKTYSFFKIKLNEKHISVKEPITTKAQEVKLHGITFYIFKDNIGINVTEEKTGLNVVYSRTFKSAKEKLNTIFKKIGVNNLKKLIAKKYELYKNVINT